MYSLNKISKAISLIALTLGCFGLSPQARAVCQEGCLTNSNTALGEDALISNTIGDNNTATGFAALTSNTTGSQNTAHGSFALLPNTEGSNNTATGFAALSSNTTGSDNTASGYFALGSNTTGFHNTATGLLALSLNASGNFNTATGLDALGNNTTGNNNTATGADALLFNTTGSNNTAIGINALSHSSHGNSNTAIGVNALARNSADNNIALGNNAGIDLRGDANIAIGNRGVPNDTGAIRLGQAGIHTDTYISGISGVTVAGGVGVIIDTDGHLGTVVSSERFKDAVRPMDKASEAILSLKPVTFRYKTALDPKGIPQFGLVAEQVEKVNPDLVARDGEGKPYTVRYEAVNAMLLNEFLKEHRKVEALQATVAAQQKSFEVAQKESQATAAQQEKEIQVLTASLKAQAMQIQEVSDQLRAQAPAPRVVDNN